MSIKGVITGDVIDSTSIPLEQRSELLEAIVDVMEKIKSLKRIDYEMFRGDSIQVLVENPGDSMLVGILMKAGLRSRTPQSGSSMWDMRVSIGVGKVEFAGTGISVSDGEAFRLSGRGLDSIGKSTLVVSTPWASVNEEFSVSTPFVDDTISRWTEGQAAQVFRTLLYNENNLELSVVFGVSPQTISRTLILAKEKSVRRFIDRFVMVLNNKISEQCQ